MHEESIIKENSRSSSLSKERTSSKSATPMILILVGTAILYFLVYNPARFGSYHDDAIYVTTAKALAQGEGYRIVSLPYEPDATKYPPFYPALLSLVWRIDPHFPENVNWMVAMTATVALCFLALTWFYLVRQAYAKPWQALLVVAMTAVNWRMVIFATGIYSEMLYAALTVGALILAERLNLRRWNWTRGIALGVVVGLAFLTRTTGVALITAVAVYFVVQRRIRPALLPMSIALLFVAGWLFWSHLNRTTTVGINVPYYTNYLEHFKNVLLDIQANTHASMPMTILGVLWRNFLMVVVVSIPVLTLGLDYSWAVYLGFVLLFIVAGFVRAVGRGWRLLHIYVVCHLALHVVGLPFVSYDRYLAPILPFLLLCLIRELDTMASQATGILRLAETGLKKTSAAFILLAVVAIAAVAGYNYGSTLYFSLKTASFKKEVKPTTDDSDAIDWIRANTDPSDVLVCGRDPLYYLYTGRKATRSMPMTGTIYWRDKQALYLDIVDEVRGKYLVVTASDFEESYQPELQTESFKAFIDGNPDKFEPLFRAANGRSAIYLIKQGERSTPARASG
jgi:4-amino-4-deoxy-L-arabinose transferase-like glycosyltransferase